MSQAVAIATGVSIEGRLEILGMRTGDSENTDFWTQFLRGPRERGLKTSGMDDPEGVAVVVSNTRSGLKAEVKAILPGAGWQRYRVHLGLLMVWLTPRFTLPERQTRSS